VDFGDNDQRTMTADDIISAHARGEVTEDTFVWADGMSDWTAIAQVPELASALASAAPAPAAAAPRAAARSGAGRGSATDLFGGIDRAGSEEDVTTSAQQGMAAAPAPTGARNESSVLFSLSALTASGPAASPSKSSSKDSSDDHDSGLIDLKALTSSVTAQVPANPLALGTAPLGMAAPLGGISAPAISADGPAPQAQNNKTGIYLAAAVLLVGTLIAGAIVMVGGKEAAPVPVPAVVPEPVAVAPAEVKKEEPTAEPPATGTTGAEAPPKEEAPKPTSAPRATGRSTARAKAAAAAAAESKPEPKAAAAEPKAASGESGEKKPKKKKTDNCNCAPSDLMCAMKCAAG
jgi:hypothetical protein